MGKQNAQPIQHLTQSNMQYNRAQKMSKCNKYKRGNSRVELTILDMFQKRAIISKKLHGIIKEKKRDSKLHITGGNV